MNAYLQRHEVNLNVSFTPAPPTPRRQHRVRDIFWLLVASALIGLAAVERSVVFSTVFGVAIVLYVIGDTKA